MKTSRILVLLKISRSTHYHTLPTLHLRRRRKVSRTTEKITESGLASVSEDQLLQEITVLLGREFVCYGYKKVYKHLQRSGYAINRKKVLRILKEHSLLNHAYNYRSPAKRVVESIVRVHTPNEVWEMDIKYISIQRENRTAYLFAIIDCFTREVVGKHLRYHCTSQDVKMAMDFAFLDRGISGISGVRIGISNMREYIPPLQRRMHILSHSTQSSRRK